MKHTWTYTKGLDSSIHRTLFGQIQELHLVYDDNKFFVMGCDEPIL